MTKKIPIVESTDPLRQPGAMFGPSINFMKWLDSVHVNTVKSAAASKASALYNNRLKESKS